MDVNILDINATIHINEPYASLIEPDHVKAVIERYGYELKEQFKRVSIYLYVSIGCLPDDNGPILIVPDSKYEDWQLRLSELLGDVEQATGEKQLKVLCDFLIEAGHNPSIPSRPEPHHR